MQKHLDVINIAIAAINTINRSPFIINGGTALMKCYGLDRISEDIDLDCDNSLSPENGSLDENSKKNKEQNHDEEQDESPVKY